MPKLDSVTLLRMLEVTKKSGNSYGNLTESRCVASLDFELSDESGRGDLLIVFQQRGSYVYHDVPVDAYIDLAGAGSQGTYFNLYIRDNYSYERTDQLSLNNSSRESGYIQDTYQ